MLMRKNVNNDVSHDSSISMQSKNEKGTTPPPPPRLKRLKCFHASFCGFVLPVVTRGHKVTDHIIFATPGTLLNWILRHRVMDPKKVKMFVLEDVDVMIALQGHQDQFLRIYK